MMQRLEHVSLQSPVLPQDFVPTFEHHATM